MRTMNRTAPNRHERKRQRSHAYERGMRDALEALPVKRDQLATLRTDADYWQGWHDGRRDAVHLPGASILEDPTRPGGWCVRPVGG